MIIIKNFKGMAKLLVSTFRLLQFSQPTISSWLVHDLEANDNW